MNRWTTRLAVVVAAGALTLGLPAVGAAYGASRAHAPVSRLDRVLSRLDRLGHRMLLAGSGQGELAGVDVRARADGWAVGTTCANRACTHVNTLIRHWNGRRWSRVPSPNPGSLQILGSVSAVSPSDAWAVGLYLTRNNEAVRTLVEHWNGRRWSRVPSPNPSASATDGFNELDSVTALSGQNAWAAGFVQQGPGDRPLFLHWNGIRWSTMASPRKTSNSQIDSISAASARDIWAVGSYGDTADHALIEHWNGTTWRIVTAPARPAGQVVIDSVTALSARSAWAAGMVCPEHCQRANPPSRMVILHWNGRRWATAATPSAGTASALAGVAATSATNAWAVGEFCTKNCALEQFPAEAHMLILHWNGSRWARIAGPSLGHGVHILEGVSTLSRRSAWAVGQTACLRNCSPGLEGHPLELHWNGRRWLT